MKGIDNPVRMLLKHDFDFPGRTDRTSRKDQKKDERCGRGEGGDERLCGEEGLMLGGKKKKGRKNLKEG
jgi:hypothetical protein